MVVIMANCVQISTDNGNNHVQKSELRYVVYIWECINSGMDYWNGGNGIFKSSISVFVSK